MSKKINKKTKGTIIILVLIVVVVIVLIIGNNLRQTSQKKEEFQEGVEKVEKETEKIEKIDINKADIETLSKLPGIGPVKSKAILDYREKIGKFQSLIELIEVKGIGKKTLAKLLPYLEMIGDSTAVKAFLTVEESIEILGKININSASKSHLMSLTGIGEGKANAIIEYRKTNGPFKSIEEIKNVKGIGEGIFEKIKDKIEVSKKNLVESIKNKEIIQDSLEIEKIKGDKK